MKGVRPSLILLDAGDFAAAVELDQIVVADALVCLDAGGVDAFSLLHCP